MKLIGKVPVEPLDDERLTNIERKLVVAVSDMRAPAPSSRRVLMFASVAMAIALAGFVGWKLREAPVADEKAQTFAMKSSAERSLLDLGDAQLASAPGTDVRIERRPAKTLVMMERGELSLTVEHKPGRLLVVRAGDTEIEDIGTKFSVLFDGKSHVEVRVTEGEVKVHRAGKEFAVTEANAWTTELGATTIAQLDAAAVNVVAHSGANDGNHVDTSAVDTRGAVTNGGSAVVDDRGSVVDNRGSDNRGADNRASDHRGSAGDIRGAGSGSGSTKKPRRSGLKEAISGFPLNPLPGTPAELTEQLNEQMRTGGDTSTIMYSIAVSQHLAKDDNAALHSISGPLTRNRKSDAAYKDIMWLNVRIKCLKAFDDDCRIAANRYLINVPTGSAAGIAQDIVKQAL